MFLVLIFLPFWVFSFLSRVLGEMNIFMASIAVFPLPYFYQFISRRPLTDNFTCSFSFLLPLTWPHSFLPCTILMIAQFSNSISCFHFIFPTRLLPPPTKKKHAFTLHETSNQIVSIQLYITTKKKTTL